MSMMYVHHCPYCRYLVEVKSFVALACITEKLLLSNRALLLEHVVDISNHKLMVCEGSPLL